MKVPRRTLWLLALAGSVTLAACSMQPITTRPVGSSPQKMTLMKAEQSLGPVETPVLASRPAMSVALPESQIPAGIQALANVSLDGKLLVISATGQDADFGAIRQTLDYLGVPYTVWICRDHPQGLTADQLFNGTHGYYQGVILSDGSLAMFDGSNWVSALSDAEWATLWSYEASFGVRQLNWYGYPTAAVGLNVSSAVDTTTSPISAKLTSAGQAAFPYLNGPLVVRNAYTYLAKPTDAQTVPLLTDSAGNALASTRTYPDGRQTLALTFDSNPYLNHSIALGCGLVNWVTKGVFLGEQRTYVSVQVDDLLIGTDLYPSGEYRITGSDISALGNWQKAKRGQALTKGFTLSFAFNGQGWDEYGTRDSLNRTLANQQDDFFWISHTYDHPEPNLDTRSYAEVTTELRSNISVAKKMKLRNFSLLNFVSPEISGLANPEAMRAEYDAGIRFVVSDTSRPGQNNPSPNAGILNACQPGILELPRYPTNLFYNVSKPAEWAAEYNSLYRSYWGRDLTITEILDKESDVLLQYMLKGSWNPWMFHQANLRAYNGKTTLLGDLIDQAFSKYAKLYKFPVISVPMEQLGVRVQDRMAFNQAGVTALIRPGVSITLTASGSAKVPVTGYKGAGAESYGGLVTTRVSMQPGKTVTLSLK